MIDRLFNFKTGALLIILGCSILAIFCLMVGIVDLIQRERTPLKYIIIGFLSASISYCVSSVLKAELIAKQQEKGK